MKEFISVLRKPDNAISATEASPFRFEENAFNNCPVKYDYIVGEKSAKVVVYPSGSPVKYLKFRFRGDFSFIDKVYGDQWARSSFADALEWKSVVADRAMPWFTYVIGENKMKCYGVKTGADCFAMWQVDTFGVTLFLNLTCDTRGTDLKEPLVACEVVELEGEIGEDPYKVAKKFSYVMCENGVLPKTPVFGVNNWYWAYGNVSHDSVMDECDYLMEMTEGCKNSPYMIIDDGWQKFRKSLSGKDEGFYIGGPWTPNAKFPDIYDTANQIHAKGAKAGLWFRPLLTREDLPKEVITCEECNGLVLDPSHPFVIEKVEKDANLIASYGFDLIKHDFSRQDAMGAYKGEHNADKVKPNRRYYDNTKTTATIVKNIYKAIQKGAGKVDIIGCDVFGHLSAGIHSLQRVGADTSGRSWEWTRSDGVNSVMRLPTNNVFYNIDPDCAAFTNQVDSELNLDFLEMCAITGMTTLASVTPHTLNKQELKRINEIYRMADGAKYEYGIKNYDKNANPDTFISPDGKDQKVYNWYRKHDGARTAVTWFE